MTISIKTGKLFKKRIRFNVIISLKLDLDILLRCLTGKVYLYLG